VKQDRSDLLDKFCKRSLENLVPTSKVEGQREDGRQQLTLLGWLERLNWHSNTSHNQSTDATKKYRRHDCRCIRILARHNDWL